MIILGVHDRWDVFCDLSVVCDPGDLESMLHVSVRSGCKKSVSWILVRYILNINILSVLIFHAWLVQQNAILFGI